MTPTDEPRVVDPIEELIFSRLDDVEARLGRVLDAYDRLRSLQQEARTPYELLAAERSVSEVVMHIRGALRAAHMANALTKKLSAERRRRAPAGAPPR